MKFSNERKKAVIGQLLPPNNKRIAEVSGSEGISPATLYKWRNQAMQELHDAVAQPCVQSSDSLHSKKKFDAVVETASMHDNELAEYCQRHGLQVDQLKRWRAACVQANWHVENVVKRQLALLESLQQRNRDLLRQVRYSESHLSELIKLVGQWSSSE